MTKATSCTAHRTDGLTGTLLIPGDKSISHRALIFGALSAGETTVHGLLASDDVMATAAAMRAYGAQTEQSPDGVWTILGRGAGALRQPDGPLDFGNSGTGARLTMGLAASHPVVSVFIGDESLSRRPMARVLDPLRETGAQIEAADGGRLPVRIEGAGIAMPVSYRLPVASAQVKSAILLAGLNAAGITRVIEPVPTRDHTERMLRHFGADLKVEDTDEGRVILLRGQTELTPGPVRVPSDPSSAAFAIVAALITEGSDITLPHIMMNDTRRGLVDTLVEMGGRIDLMNAREENGEPLADLRVRSSALHGVTVPAERAPSMIDEYPVLAAAAAFAEGRTTMLGLDELRVKESDRLSAVAAGLAACGIPHEEGRDSLAVDGSRTVPGGGTVKTHLDHRIAMAFLVLGLAAENPVTVDDTRMIATSFPAFLPLLEGAGVRFTSGDTE